MSSVNSQAESYERRSALQRGVGTTLIDELVVEKGNTILDLGCGTGYLTKLLSDHVGPDGRVVAVDPDKERLKIAREKHSASNIEYIEADSTTFPEAQYDIIFANAVIHWIKDKEALFKRVHQNLRPGGRFAFSTGDGFLPVPPIGKKLFDELVSPDFLHSQFNEKMVHLNVQEYETLASATGFGTVSMNVQNIELEWKNLDDYIDSMFGWFQGEFDPAKFSTDTLGRIKQECGDGPIKSEPLRSLTAILTKPSSS